MIVSVNLSVCLLSPRGHLATKGCPAFVVEFNNYSIKVDDPMSLTSLLHGEPHLPSRNPTQG